MWFRRILRADRFRTLNPGRASAPLDRLALSSSAIRQLNRLQITASRSLPGSALGSRASLHRRPAADFREHRMYTPGDDARFIDWKASARQEHVFIKQGEQLKDATIYLLVDCSASMAWGRPPKSAATLSLAAALGYLALAHGDRLMVIPLDLELSGWQKGLPFLGPVRGKGQFPGLLNYLQGLPFQGRTRLAPTFQRLSRREEGRTGRVVLLSDLLAAEPLDHALAMLPQPAWELTILHLLHPEEIDPVVTGDLQMEDVETGEQKKVAVTTQARQEYRRHFDTWKQSLAAACEARRTRLLTLPTHWSLEEETLPFLRASHFVSPL